MESDLYRLCQVYSGKVADVSECMAGGGKYLC